MTKRILFKEGDEVYFKDSGSRFEKGTRARVLALGYESDPRGLMFAIRLKIFCAGKVQPTWFVADWFSKVKK